jgi:hypothetical protein
MVNITKEEQCTHCGRKVIAVEEDNGEEIFRREYQEYLEEQRLADLELKEE